MEISKKGKNLEPLYQEVDPQRDSHKKNLHRPLMGQMIEMVTSNDQNWTDPITMVKTSLLEDMMIGDCQLSMNYTL